MGKEPGRGEVLLGHLPEDAIKDPDHGHVPCFLTTKVVEVRLKLSKSTGDRRE
jgi:hypothetical protein